MNISIPSILLGLGGKCVLNWALVLLQRSHVYKSFLGLFGVSLAMIDTLFALSITSLHLHAPGPVYVLGLKLTTYHVCVLVQVLGEIYNALQWPAVVLAALDHSWAVTRRSEQPTSAGPRWVLLYVCVMVLLYYEAVYLFLLSDFVPVLEDVTYHQIHQCWVSPAPQIPQITVFLLLTLGCAALHGRCCRGGARSSGDISSVTNLSGNHHSVVRRVVHTFLGTWDLFLVFFLALVLLLPVGIPAYLGLNVAWLCFVNSLLIALVLCFFYPASSKQGHKDIPPDSFCDWTLAFSPEHAEDGTTPQANKRTCCLLAEEEGTNS